MNLTISKALKSLVLCTALSTCALALALPSPKDIEAAVSQGHLPQAESMLRSVIEAKPQSAKAHYELGQVLLREHRTQEAHTELLAAKAIDPSLKFATSSQQFETLLAQTSAHSNAASASMTSADLTHTSHSESGFSLTFVWVGIAALLGVALFIRSRKPAPGLSGMPATTTNAGLSTAFGRNPAYAPTYPSASYPQAPPSSGSAMTGAVVGGLVGVAAGYALTKALDGEHHSTPTASNYNSWTDQQGLVKVDEADAPAFDTGSGGNDWDDDSESASDDSW